MEIKSERPAGRGVSQLMYVGDDQAVDNAVGPQISTREVGLGVVCAAVALTTKGTPRLVAGGIAAVIALRMFDRNGFWWG